MTLSPYKKRIFIYNFSDSINHIAKNNLLIIFLKISVFKCKTYLQANKKLNIENNINKFIHISKNKIYMVSWLLK